MSLYRRLLGAALVAILLSPCAQAAEPVRVGSKIDTEGALLGNLIQLVLEANGIKTVNRLQIGTTKVVRGALLSGEVDVYPEYTGNGAFFFSDEKNPAWKNPENAYQLVKKLDFEKNKLVWLTPSPANNTWLIAVRKDMAQANKLKTLADLGRWINQGGRFKLAASAEFIERPDALPAFENSYGFKLKQDQLLTLAGGDTAATIKAAAEQTSGVNAAMVYGTDGAIAALGLVTLDDVKAVQPVYAPTAVIRGDVLARYPNIPDLLKPVFMSLDSPTLQRLNAGIAIEGRDARKIAGDYLRSKGFIK
ncbi:osmoprotectant transport system substrate-binding protein [Collimonas sp. OK607]|uniref:glycine betaine ABC transporter substrate-binding protein OsmF n=1 Tax=Collimonas sp. OK607 TaxID=1798194 RepID=UPI0008E5DF87|nr:ABC transporter substrate-binding protein [Collimonas sp. OK607]SFA99921.1 osmoprotectant transport system substrate-binding protein [Collimonas sp. OK607]